MKFLNILLKSVLCTIVYSLPCNNKDNDAEVVNEELNEEPINDYEIKHQNILDKYLSECTVLLRKNGDFPLSSKEKKTYFYLYGNGVRKTVKGGLGSGDIEIRSFDTIETAFMKNAYDDCYEKAHKEYIKKLQDEFDYENARIRSCYLMSYQDHLVKVLTEMKKKGDVFLTDTERKIIKTLARGFKKFLLVLNTMGPVDLSGLDEVKNILALSQLGAYTSKNIIKSIHLVNLLLHGLKKYDDYIANFGNVTDTDYLEGIYVADVDVLFPFGYGLGYTDFKIKYNKVSLIGDKVNVNASVKNIDKFKGKEILELYLSKPNTKLMDESYQIFVNFAKTKELKSGRKDNVKLEFKLSDFASYDSKSQSYILEAGSYIVRFGNSSRNTIPCAVIELPSRVIIIEDMTFHSKKKRDNLNGLLITISPYEIDETIKSLFVQNQTVVMPDIIAGSAGEFYKFRDLKPIILSDGPEGLRKFPDSTLEIIPDDAKPSLSFLFPNIPEGVKFYYQYIIAIPIAMIGDIIGSEMNLFKINLWLAPALNIHRSILNDPYISGTIASSVIKGVQSHKNAYATLKHFIANNKEKRAFRKIYLKEYEIAIKNANSKAIMSSYNLVNGIHVNENAEYSPYEIIKSSVDKNKLSIEIVEASATKIYKFTKEIQE
ncbi:glycoside hydrolase family 3 protein [Neocallimastix lanati (nom. inval.)]|nr:glycoside hydrolase family 3 protein [Neocallimastix sp. JGI-2020a]